MATCTLDTELTCSICLEFYKDPYQLPCMHSFCKQCLIEFSKPKITCEDDDDGCSNGTARLTTDKEENVLECPECRHIVTLDEKGIGGLPKNFTLANIVKKYAKKEESEDDKKYMCDVCDSEPPREAVKSCIQCGLIYCRSCLVELHPNRGKMITHKLVEPSDHQCAEIISDEDSELIDNLLLSRNNLVVLKRKIERKTKDIQKNIGSLQAQGDRRKKETKAVFDRLSAMLKAKEEQCDSEVDDEVGCKTDSLTQLLTSCHQITEDINKLMKDAKVSVEDFPRKTTRSDLQTIQKRLWDLEKKQVNFLQQNLTSACGMVDTHEIEENLEALGQNVVSENANEHTLDINVTLVPVREGATIYVTWNNISEKDIYDVIAECVLPCGIRERFLYSGIQGCEYKMTWLRPETVYQICVAIQGEINMESRGVTIQTLESIECPSFTLNGTCANKFTSVSQDSKLMVPTSKIPNISDFQPSSYTRLKETTGTIDILSGNTYWQCRIIFYFPEGLKKDDQIFATGICYRSDVDRIANVSKNFNAYIVYAVKKGNEDIYLNFVREGKGVLENRVDVDLESEMEHMELQLGFYVDREKCTFSVINVTENHILWTFDDIRMNTPHAPVFVHRKPTVVFQLLTGGDIQEIPSCLLELLK